MVDTDNIIWHMMILRMTDDGQARGRRTGPGSNIISPEVIIRKGSNSFQQFQIIKFIHIRSNALEDYEYTSYPAFMSRWAK